MEHKTTRQIKLIRITTVPVSLKVLLKNQLRFMSGHFELVAVSSPGEQLDEVNVQENVRTKAVTMTRAITPVSDLKAVWSLYRFFRREKPSIVHTHTPKAGLLGMIAAKAAGVPIRLHTVAGLPLMENTGMKRKILEYTERLTYSSATRVYPNSKNLASFIRTNKFCLPGKVSVLGNGSSNGIDTAFFSPGPDLENQARLLRKQFGIDPENFVFVFIGRMVKDKGIEELVSAFNALKKSHPQIRLLLVGPYEHALDPVAGDTRKTIEEDENIFHVGFQHDVRPYLMISHALAFPSYREGFPNVPMQAGCFDLPAIVTDINGCNEIIEQENNGLIIPVKDAVALEKAMRRLMEDTSLYVRLQTNARKMIVDRYEQKHFWSILLNEYHNQLTLQHVSS